MKSCRKCGARFEPTERQKRRYDWLCPICKRKAKRKQNKKAELRRLNVIVEKAKCRKCGDEYKPTQAQIKKYSWICRKCSNILNRPYNRTERAKQSVQRWRQSERGKKRIRQKSREFRKNPDNEQKLGAYDVVKYALKTGRLKKKPCEVCGDLKVDAHHEDYSKPLEVNWLCRLHHQRLHIDERQKEGGYPNTSIGTNLITD